MNWMGWLRNRWVLGGIALVVLLGVAGAYPAYQAAKVWRAESLAAQAEALLEDPDRLVDAWEKARAAHALAPGRIEIARVVARLYDVADPAAAPGYWRAVVEASAGESADRLALAEALLRTDDLGELAEQLAVLKEQSYRPGEVMHLRARAALQQGDLNTALEVVRELIDRPDAPEGTPLFYVQLQLLSPQPDVRAAGMRYLMDLLEGDGSLALSAARNLARAPGLDPERTRRVADRIAGLDPPDREDRLLRYELLARLPEVDRQTIAREAAREFNLDDRSELAAFGRWLNRHGFTAQTVSVISEADALSRQDLFLVRADAMALLGEWEAIGALLNQRRVPLEDYLRAFFRMRVHLERGEARRASIEWDRALLAAGPHPERLAYLADKARVLGLSGYYQSALERMTELPLVRRGGYERLIAHLQSEGRSRELLGAYRRMADDYPRDDSVQNDLRYLRFLLQDVNEAELQAARRLVESNPALLAYRMTLALGLVRSDRSAEALQALDGLAVNWFEVRDRWRVILATALHAEGYRGDARHLAESVDARALLPEEREIWLAVMDGAGAG